MAHAREEVEEMVGLAGALVLNIGTLSPAWVDAMVAAAAAANARGVPVVLDPVGAGATRYRTETAKRILDTIDVAVLRGNAGEVATLVGVEAEVRGVESVGVGGDPADLAREAARSLGVVASVTGAVDHVSDGERSAAVANGHPLLAAVTGTGCMSTAMTGCFLAAKDDAFEAAVEALVAFGVAGEDAAAEAKGPGSFHVALYDALAALDPATLSSRAEVDMA
jgi:hydroxyethylthiazole kinase